MKKLLSNKLSKKISFFLKKLFSKMVFLFFLTKPGSTLWLIKKEIYFGGLQTGIARNLVSKYDERKSSEIKSGGMTGGDRMLFHGYARFYSKFLKTFITKRNLEFNILEVGILQGTGLAVWASLFPNSNIFGADIDLDYFKKNITHLNNKGNFNHEKFNVFKFDQLKPRMYKTDFLTKIKLNIVIDDGLHTKDAILNTAQFLKPYLANQFVYFIEDVKDPILNEIKNIFQDCYIFQKDKLIVITN